MDFEECILTGGEGAKCFALEYSTPKSYPVLRSGFVGRGLKMLAWLGLPGGSVLHLDLFRLYTPSFKDKYYGNSAAYLPKTS